MSKKIILLLRIAASILGAILSLIIAHNFNPFSTMTFIPQDKVYDVCITIYFSIAEVIISFGMDKIEEIVSGYYMDIEAVLSHRNEEAGLDSQPTIRFNEVDMSEVSLTLKIHGKRKYFNNIEVVIPRIAQADYQLGRQSLGASINSNGDFCIKISAICGYTETVDLTETFLITLQRAPVDNSARVTISPEARPIKHKRIRFSNNTAVVQLEVRE